MNIIKFPLGAPGVSRLAAVLLSCLLASGGGHAGVTGAAATSAGRPPAPELELTDVYGAAHSLSQMRGFVVLVNFWATWCPPCRWEMPDLQALWQRLGDENFRILAVAVGEDRAAINRYYHSLPEPLTFTLLPDPENRVARSWPSHGIPATFVIDTSGRIAHVVNGARQWDRPEVVAALRALMAESAGAGPRRPRPLRIRLDAGR